MKAADFENELSTEQIRNRMIKNAARIWGVEVEEIESTFDPIVTMLIEACSYELNKINREMLSSRSRIMNRLAQTLSPESLIGANPAHTVMQARSIEIETLIDRDAQFSTVIKQHSVDVDKKEVAKDIYFSPLRSYKVFDAQVKYSISGTKIFEYRNAFSKQVVAEELRSNLNPHTLWLGIEVNSKIQSLNDFVFFLDWKNDPDEYRYLRILPLTKWSVGPYKLDAVQGIQQEMDRTADSTSIDDEYNITLRTERQVEQYYNDSFYTVKSGDAAVLKLQDFLVSYPSEVKDVFSEQALSKMEGKLVWLKLQFNSAMPVNAVQDVFISINSFPAINRRLNKLTYQLKNAMNIVPLASENLFHDIIHVVSTEGNQYQSNPLGSGFSNAEGFFTLRNGGVERFDQRHAMEQLSNIIDLLRDENAAFSSLGNDFINVQINQVNQALAMIENRLDLKGTKERPTHFILVKPMRKNDTVFARFWSTDGPDAHGVKPGSKLTLQSGAEVKSDSIFTVVSTSGGKMPLNEGEKILAYKKALLTRDRLLTEQDIQSFCSFELGNLVKKVTVKKAWEIPADRKSGITRVVEVRLFPVVREGFVKSEWKDLAKSLQTKLRMQSSEFIPINVVVNLPESLEAKMERNN
jgi:hypothetical protein